MVKYLIFVIGLMIGANCSAQKPVAAIESPEFNILYRGYDNKIIPAVTNNDGRTIVVSATNASISREPNQEFYNVRPGTGKIVRIMICLEDHATGRTETIKTIEYRVSNLPDPEMYWGGVQNKGQANIRAPKFSVKYPPAFPLSNDFRILSWTLSFEGDTISGNGPSISSAEEFLKKIKSGTTLIFQFKVLSNDGITRLKMGQWKVTAWKDEADPNLIRFD